MDKRLAIVVPYRDRKAHLGHFLPHMATFIVQRSIPCRIVIVEQTDGKPFNRGALLNVGFDLTRKDSDYVCFHDVDYLPLDADYSFPNQPCCAVWYGAETRPIDPATPQRRIVHRLEQFFGGVVLASKEHFETVNGYSNRYWGWGHEDTDLRRRFKAQNIPLGRRKGRFHALDHKNAGFELDGSPSEESTRTRATLMARWSGPNVSTDFSDDGLTTLRYETRAARSLAIVASGGKGPPRLRADLVTVELTMDADPGEPG